MNKKGESAVGYTLFSWIFSKLEYYAFCSHAEIKSVMSLEFLGGKKKKTKKPKVHFYTNTHTHTQNQSKRGNLAPFVRLRKLIFQFCMKFHSALMFSQFFG